MLYSCNGISINQLFGIALRCTSHQLIAHILSLILISAMHLSSVPMSPASGVSNHHQLALHAAALHSDTKTHTQCPHTALSVQSICTAVGTVYRVMVWMSV